MASTQPDTENRETAAALALLLANVGRRYDLPSLIRQAKVKPRRWAPIRPTNGLKADLAAPHFDIAKAWAAQIDTLMWWYERGDVSAIAAQTNASAAQVEQIVQLAKRRFPAIVQRIEAWHRGQWISRAKASTGLDVSMLTQPGDVVDDMQATTAWNQSLADDVHQQTKNRVSAALLAGAAASLPASQVKAQVADAITKARKRAAGIGDDQVDKLSRAMDRSRRQAASITQFIWGHTAQKHPRDWHLARNGKIFAEGDIPADDRAGVPPFCKCFEVPVLQ